MMKRLAVLIGLIAILAGLLVGCGPTALPVIVEFSATPSEIQSGESTTLSWNVTGATSLSIDQGIGNVSAIGAETVSPTTTTAYTLTASNAVANVTKSVVISVTSVPPTPSSPSSFVPYRSDAYGYAINHPSDWGLDTEKLDAVRMYPPPPSMSSISILVAEGVEGSLPAEQLAQIFVELMTEAYSPSFTVLDSKQIEGMWDWYVSCEYESFGTEFYAEVYYKSTEQYMYVVFCDLEKEDYEAYPLSDILDTFTLLPE